MHRPKKYIKGYQEQGLKVGMEITAYNYYLIVAVSTWSTEKFLEIVVMIPHHYTSNSGDVILTVVTL